MVKYACHSIIDWYRLLYESQRLWHPQHPHLSPLASPAKLTYSGSLQWVPSSLFWEGLDWPPWNPGLHSGPVSHGHESSLSTGCLCS